VKTIRLRFLKSVLASGILAALTAVAPMKTASADTYPSRAIKIVVPVAVGGGSDVTTRRVADAMSKILGQPIIIENRPGAAGIIASEVVAKAAPDGYTLLAGTRTTKSFNIALYKSLPYHPIDSYAPVGRMNSFPNVLVVAPSLGVNSIKELVDLAKRSSRSLSAASGGVGTSPYLMSEILKMIAKIDLLQVPYKDSSAFITDTIAGRMDLVFANIPQALPHVVSGRLKALAVTSETRSSLLPDVPTVVEAGFSDLIFSNWVALLAPRGTSAEVTTTLNNAVRKALEIPEVRQALLAVGSDIESDASPSEFAKFLKTDVDRWTAVIKATGAVPQ
jgi:tripartite-type tricarboxylate transporter receptor subunit TctC